MLTVKNRTGRISENQVIQYDIYFPTGQPETFLFKKEMAPVFLFVGVLN
jgi:hypothetical protein